MRSHTIKLRPTRSRATARAACARRSLAVALAACLGACSEIPVEAVDDILEPPRAVLHGAVLYVGPRPACSYDALGAPLAVSGNVVLTLIDDAKPLPPEGTNQQPASFLAIPGSNLFETSDCRPADPSAFDPDDTVMASVPFTWPQVPLAGRVGETISYRVTAFYDQRGDFSPFFTVQSATTAGDVAGAAVVSQADPSFELVTVGNVIESPLGEQHIGISVTLGGVVRTEPPMFRVVGGPLDAALPIPIQLTGPSMQSTLLATSSFTLRMFGRDLASGSAEDQDLDRVLDLLRPGADPSAPRLIDPQLDDEIAYAWYHKQLDFDGNGIPDEHQVLGPIRDTNSVPADSPEVFRLETPVVLMQRVRTPEEVRAGIPDVGMQAATPNRDHGSFPDLPGVEYPDSAVIVPPVASVLLALDVAPICQVPYMPPGSPREFYEARPENPAPVECHEIPTGPYGVNVMHGIVGGTVVADADSQTGFDIDGGSFASQIWAVPNALGDLDQVADLIPDDAPVQGPVTSQSVDGAIFLVDSTPTGPTGRHEDPDHCITLPADPLGETRAPTYKEFPDNGECAAGLPALEDLCCERVRHLCFVPRCPYDACNPGIISPPREGMGETRSFSYTNSCGETVNDTAYFPECVPFYMPEICCDEIWGDDRSQMPAPITEPFDSTCP